MDYCLALQKPKKVREIERVILTCYFDEERGKKDNTRGNRDYVAEVQKFSCKNRVFVPR